MGFSEAKKAVINALRNGNFMHATRESIEIKNELATGVVTPDEVAKIIKGCRGFNHSTSPLHGAPHILVHIFKKNEWYIKFYFIDETTMFISVHK
ncbi:MAG: hypothetical protein OQK24_12725 [Magnetovibrio sp.]|nr:hypothetical protein [Magnetovibrio sp.]